VDLALFCGDAFRSREPLTTLQCLLPSASAAWWRPACSSAAWSWPR
jgi:hypothetical protein